MRAAGRRRRAGAGVLAWLALLLGGCSSVAPPTAPPAAQRPVPASPGPVDRRAAQPAALTAERQWLQSWFDGTPVSIVSRGGRSVTVDVPLAHSFEPGRSRVKPALAAVLDKVAQSMRRLPYAAMPLIAAPDDARPTRGLALQRATQVQRHLRNAGVPASRLGPPVATTADAVQLRIDVEEP